MASKSKILVFIILIFAAYQVVLHFYDLEVFDDTWECEGYLETDEFGYEYCGFLDDLDVDFIVILFISTCAYIYDGPVLTKKRNIFVLFLIYYLTIAIGSDWAYVAIFAIFPFLTGFDSGKNAAQFLNTRSQLEIAEKIGSLTQHEDKPKVRSNAKNFKLDGILGISIFGTVSLSLSISFDLISVELADFIFPSFDFSGVSIDLKVVNLILSLLLVFYRSCSIVTDWIFLNKYFLKIPKYESIIQKLKILLYLFTLWLVFAAILWFLERFIIFITITEIQIFVESTILMLWALGYLLNS